MKKNALVSLLFFIATNNLFAIELRNSNDKKRLNDLPSVNNPNAKKIVLMRELQQYSTASLKRFVLFGKEGKLKSVYTDYLPLSGGVLTGTLYGTNAIFSGIVNSPNNGFDVDNGVGGNGIFKGNGDGASLSTYNVAVRSWYGIAFPSSIDGQNRITFNTRSGDAQFAGTLLSATAIFNQQLKLRATSNPNPNISGGDQVYNSTGFFTADLGLENSRIESYYTNGQYIDRGGLKFYTRDGDGLVPRLIINSAGTATFNSKVGISNLYPQATLDLGNVSTQSNYHFPLFWYNDDNTSQYSGTKGGIYLDQFSLPNNTTLSFGTSSANDGTFMVASKNTFDGTSSSLTPRVTVRGQSGNVGIGTTNPQEKLHIMGNAKLEAGQIRFFTSYNDGGGGTGIVGNPNGWTRIDPNGSRFIITASPTDANNGNNLLDIERVDTWQHLMELRGDGGAFFNGNVLIGKTTQSNTSYKLDVAGNIRANKLVVNTTGADYVFDSSYRLAPLTEVETFINQNKHLPGIEPAKQMSEQGLDVGDNQTKLLQKIEELTLYMIEMKKENQKQQKEIESLKQQVQKQNKQ